MIVKTEERNSYGRRHRVWVADYEGTTYEFDPLGQALKGCGATEITAENQKTIVFEALDYEQTARIRAEAGTRLRYVRQAIAEWALTGEEIEALWREVWADHYKHKPLYLN
jgi:hypothetical protein